jgi:hypothetical protein
MAGLLCGVVRKTTIEIRDPVMAACCAILETAQAAITFNSVLFPTCYGIQFAEQPRNRNTIYPRPMRFDMICEANGIEHRLTKPN